MFVPGGSRAWLRFSFRCLPGLFLTAVPASCVLAATFAVNSTVDVVDANPGDGICRTAPGNTVCTLRAAIMETNALAGADTINLQANTTYLLDRPGTDDELGLNGDLDVLDSVTIVGAGPASTIIDGNGIATGDRVMTVFRCIGNAPAVNGVCPNGTDIIANISGVGFKRGRRPDGDLSGGGLFNRGMLTIHSCAFTENSAGSGGGITSFGTLAISNSTVAGNTITGFVPKGGGVYVGGVGGMTMVDTTVRDNVASGSAFSPDGGGIYVGFTTATINRSTINNNFAAFGGGIASTSATLHLINTTLSGNLAFRSGGGLAVYSGTADLYNVTIASNLANSDASGTTDFGGGVYRDMGTLTFRNSILTNNLHLNQGSGPSNDECFGGINSSGNNIVTIPGTVCTIAGSYAAVAASLGPLQNNGGPTQTHALLMGSAAINAGNPSGCTDNLGAILTTDQRGEPRPVGAACDIGAFELSDTVFKDGFES